VKSGFGGLKRGGVWRLECNNIANRCARDGVWMWVTLLSSVSGGKNVSDVQDIHKVDGAFWVRFKLSDSQLALSSIGLNPGLSCTSGHKMGSDGDS
jgi:hypothetical protein